MAYLWRAVDHEGEILENYVTETRDMPAALRFMKKAIKRLGSPEAITTDGLRLYGAAMDELGNRAKQQIDHWANDRVEKSHLAFSTTRARDAQIPANEFAAEIRVGARIPPQPFCSATPSRRQTYLQGASLGRAGRAAFARQLREDAAGIISPSGDRFAADR
jgi:IS1 family transposase